MRHRHRAFLDVALVVAATIGGYTLIELPLRRAETALSMALAASFGRSHFILVGGTSVLETPLHGSAFLAVVTPACSSAASACSLLGLAWLVRSGPAGRRLLAAGSAVAAVVLGNVLRLAATLAVGLVAGRSSLIMFHNWVASVFSFAYTLGGFVLMLYVLLPDRRTPAVPSAVPRGGRVELA